MQAVIFVIDSSNKERLSEAQGELVKLISEEILKDACLLILANKQVITTVNGSLYTVIYIGFHFGKSCTNTFCLLKDVASCATIEEITETFSLYKLCCGRSWHIQACDATSGTGLSDGLDWLSRQLVAAGAPNDLTNLESL